MKTRKLIELCEMRPAKSEARARLNECDLVSFLPMADLGELQKDCFATQERPLSEVEGSYTYFAEGDILLAKITPCFENGKLGIARGLSNRAGFGSSEYFVIRPGPLIDPEYLYYFLAQDWIRARGSAAMVGAVGHKRVPKEFVENLDVPVLTLAEQKRIVAILDEAFEGIGIATANAERNLANARELFEAKLNAVFETDDNGWIERRLGSLVTIKHGFAFKSEYFCGMGPYALLTPGNFHERGGYRDRGERQKFYDGPVPSGFVLDAGELLVAMTEQAAGLLGSPLIVPDTGVFLHNQRLGLVQPLAGVAWHAGFFQHLFNTKKFRTRVHRDATGVKVRHTSPEKLCNVHVRTPVDAEKLEAVADELDGFKAETSNLERLYAQKLHALARIKLTILTRAFSGQLTAARERAA